MLCFERLITQKNSMEGPLTGRQISHIWHSRDFVKPKKKKRRERKNGAGGYIRPAQSDPNHNAQVKTL